MSRRQIASKNTISNAGDDCKIKPTLGFGVPATSDPHHFKVKIPSAGSGKVCISEHLGMRANSDDFSVMDRATLDRQRWFVIRNEVQRSFNTRLKAHGLGTSSWRIGENSVDRLLGKELCVLVWAIEVLDIDRIPVAVANWLALRPEERWWLFGMTATGMVEDADCGWRLALRYALGDVVHSEPIYPNYKPAIEEIDEQSTLDLFNNEI